MWLESTTLQTDEQLSISTRRRQVGSRFKLFYNDQYGFRQNRSTQDAITLLVSLITEAIDSKIPALYFFMDIAKAFGTTEPEELLAN
ncbi:hypothetical protein HHI36_017492 [Cryptolaemus montrouzieri]|uniref:Reverse transcriptase domain-containing protein n=1 Tax=Cryptolaemus montrouzieri TaxID=559131 RepID=A0ABD2NNR1_9CUCU